MKKLFVILTLLFHQTTTFAQDCTEMPSVEEFEFNDNNVELRDRAVGGGIGKYWEPGQTLRVRFLNGSQQLQNKVKKYAPEWSNYGNIHFQFVQSGYAEIRIAFYKGRGHNSYVGTDAQHIPQNQRTMNFDWGSEFHSEEEYKAIILHEFGHALGLKHEHQSPQAGIPWNKPIVYEHYKRYHGWSKQAVDRNIFQKYNLPSTHYDKYSIMHYSISNKLTLGDFEVPWNSKLSKTDKEFIAEIYPYDKPKTTGKTEGWYKSNQPAVEWVYIYNHEDKGYLQVYWYFKNQEKPTPLFLYYQGQTENGRNVFSAYYNEYYSQGQRYYKHELQLFLSPDGSVYEVDIDYVSNKYQTYSYKKQAHD